MRDKTDGLVACENYRLLRSRLGRLFSQANGFTAKQFEINVFKVIKLRDRKIYFHEKFSDFYSKM